MLIHAARRKKADPDAEIIHWTVEAPDYDEAAKAAIHGQVAEDEVLLYVRPER